MLYVEKTQTASNTFEEACLIAFSKKADITKITSFLGMGFGTIEVNSPCPQACGCWDWKETVDGFKFFRA